MDCPFEKRFPSQLNKDDAFFMSLAYNEAIKAWKKDEVPVGAVISCDNQVIASAHNEVISTGDPTAHAEILAISKAAHHNGDYRLNAMTLYVTKEPCPMCSGAMIMSRIGRIVYGVGDPKMGFLGGALDIRQHGKLNHFPLVESGVLREECHQILQLFFEKKRKK